LEDEIIQAESQKCACGHDAVGYEDLWEIFDRTKLQTKGCCIRPALSQKHSWEDQDIMNS